MDMKLKLRVASSLQRWWYDAYSLIKRRELSDIKEARIKMLRPVNLLMYCAQKNERQTAKMRLTIEAGLRDMESTFHNDRKQMVEFSQLINKKQRRPGDELKNWLYFLNYLERLPGFNLEFSKGTRRVTVTTANVILRNDRGTREALDLGTYDVTFDWSKPFNDTNLAGRGTKIITVKSTLNNLRRKYPHPHVDKIVGDVCTGDATAGCRHAMEDGRWTDAYELIVQVLMNYNGASAYAELAYWSEPIKPRLDLGIAPTVTEVTISADNDEPGDDDEPTPECGCCGGEERGENFCEACEGHHCDDCGRSCGECGDSMCTDCSHRSVCSNCENSFCRHCHTNNTSLRCEDCGSVFCNECIEDNLCNGCANERAEQDNEDAGEDAPDCQCAICVGATQYPNEFALV